MTYSSCIRCSITELPFAPKRAGIMRLLRSRLRLAIPTTKECHLASLYTESPEASGRTDNVGISYRLATGAGVVIMFTCRTRKQREGNVYAIAISGNGPVS